MINTLKKLQTDAWRTSSARYNAARRLRRRENFATVSLALMSALTVAMAFMQRVYAEPSSPADNYLSVISAALGVLLLTVSLVEWGAKTGAIAEVLHQNAEKLNGFQRKVAVQISTLNSGAPFTWSEVNSLIAEYEVLKADCRHNHSPLDDDFFRSGHAMAPEFLKNGSEPVFTAFEVLSIWVRWQMASLWYFAAMWIALVLLFLPLCEKSKWKKPPSDNAPQITAAPETQRERNPQ